MFRSIFRPYGLVWTLLNDITDVLCLSLLWCLCSLPILTAGAATAALYDAAVHGIRCREEGVYRRFFRTFRREWKQGLGFTVVWGLVLLFGSFVLAMLDAAAAESTSAGLMAGAYRCLLTVPMVAAAWSAMILSRFTHSLGSLLRTALRFLPVHPVASVLIGALTWLVLWYTGEFPLALAFSPALLALGWSLFAEPVFARYGGGLRREAPEETPEPEDETET